MRSRPRAAFPWATPTVLGAEQEGVGDGAAPQAAHHEINAPIRWDRQPAHAASVEPPSPGARPRRPAAGGRRSGPRGPCRRRPHGPPDRLVLLERGPRLGRHPPDTDARTGLGSRRPSSPLRHPRANCTNHHVPAPVGARQLPSKAARSPWRWVTRGTGDIRTPSGRLLRGSLTCCFVVAAGKDRELRTETGALQLELAAHRLGEPGRSHPPSTRFAPLGLRSLFSRPLLAQSAPLTDESSTAVDTPGEPERWNLDCAEQCQLGPRCRTRGRSEPRSRRPFDPHGDFALWRRPHRQADGGRAVKVWPTITTAIIVKEDDHGDQSTRDHDS